ncbi:MAG: hypothetical protein WBY53_06475 [Acidobacteriaceae bacterium]
MPYRYRGMSREQLLNECRLLYQREGIAAFTFDALKRHKLYFALYSKGLKLADVVNELGLGDEYQRYREAQPIKRSGGETFRWTWARILVVARELAEEQGSLPAAAWFQATGRGSLVASLYNLGYTWADLQCALQDFNNSNFVESRNGLRWLSHAEASLSNFLYARGIQHRKGGRYPHEYAEHSGRNYGIYDLAFFAADKQWIDVEVWGDSPHGLGEEYAAKRALKESFNQNNKRNFLGVEYKDCYSDANLSIVLAPYIGNIEPFRFDKPTDKLIHTTHWSNADELLEYARQIASTMPDGRFPTEEWLRKRGKWASRPGETHNTLSVYIKTWLGGVRNLRRLLDQEHVSTIEWTREKAIRAYKEFCEKYGMTPDQARQRFTRKGDLDREVYLEAARVAAAVTKYAGGATAVREGLSIDVVIDRKWTKDKVLAQAKEITEKYGLSLNQLRSDYRAGRITLSKDAYQAIDRLIGAADRLYGGTSVVMKEIGFHPPSRPRARRLSASDNLAVPRVSKG